MSTYELHALQRHAQAQLAFAKALSEVDLQAERIGERWYSTTLLPQDCDVTLLVMDPERETLTLLLGKQLDGGVLFVHPHGPAAQRYEKSVPLVSDAHHFGQHFHRALFAWATGIRRDPPDGAR